MNVLTVDGKKLTIAILFAGILGILVSFHISSYDEYNLIDIVKSHSNSNTYGNNNIEGHKVNIGQNLQVSSFPNDEKMTIYPRNFDIIYKDGLISHYKENFGEINGERHHIFKYQFSDNSVDYAVDRLKLKSEALNELIYEKTPFHQHTFKIFNTFENINDNLGKCSNIETKLNVGISDPISRDTSLTKIVENFIRSKSDYFKEFEPFFKSDVEKQLKEKTIGNYWYRLAGSSVWLEQYGVHFMISRILYSPRGVRNQPILSLTYGQIYNENWEELHDVELIVPSNYPDVGIERGSNEQLFKCLKYPSFLPIPAYHDVSKQENRYYGPEDPRLLLVKNSKGYEEPLIIFNAFQRKIVKKDLVDENNMSLSFGFYRSMFMCWPWQFQRGKLNVEDLSNEKYNNNLYNRIVELRRDGIPRVKTQKNWTPFISSKERTQYKYDKYIYFVYRWSKLEILKCNLSDNVGNESKCKFEYRLNPKLPENESVGPLRGGTQLININDLLLDYKDKLPNLKPIIDGIPSNREIWIGFARAHLKDCGCGQDVYRPNLVIITKDGENKYKISNISSFVSFDIPIIGWNLDFPNDVCVSGQPNVLIPNGISSWSLKGAELTDNSIAFQDYLTLAYSVTDYTVDIIHIQGLLSGLFNSDLNSGGKTYKLFESSNSSAIDNLGYNDDNVNCALQSSAKFCEDYGKEEAKKKEKQKQDQ